MLAVRAWRAQGCNECSLTEYEVEGFSGILAGSFSNIADETNIKRKSKDSTLKRWSFNCLFILYLILYINHLF